MPICALECMKWRSESTLSRMFKLLLLLAVAPLGLNAPATATQPAQRLGSPQHFDNVSTCPTTQDVPALRIEIPTAQLRCSVYNGDQVTLDSGVVTQITDPSIAQALTTVPGHSGTIWVAGHRQSHGGVFAGLPEASEGSLITVTDGITTATYRITGRAYFDIVNDRVTGPDGEPSGPATLDSIIRPDHDTSKARLVLQTCDGSDHRWMIYADLA